MDEKGLGKRLQEARQDGGLTQQALCQKANISYSTLAKIERGAIKSPSIFTIQSLAAALGLTLDGLLGIAAIATDAEVGSAETAPSTAAPRSKNGISFIYFDINGCLINFYQRGFTQLARETGVSADTIESAFWNYNDDVCRGQMSLDDFNAKLTEVVTTAASGPIAPIDWESYYLDAVEAIPGMDELVRWASEHYRVGLLSNIMPGFIPALRARGLIPDVDYATIIDSSEVGSIKPENSIFMTAAERAGVDPREILLIDDSRPNIMAAGKLGWHVLWCDDYMPQNTIIRAREVLELLPG